MLQCERRSLLERESAEDKVSSGADRAVWHTQNENNDSHRHKSSSSNEDYERRLRIKPRGGLCISNRPTLLVSHTGKKEARDYLSDRSDDAKYRTAHLDTTTAFEVACTCGQGDLAKYRSSILLQICRGHVHVLSTGSNSASASFVGEQNLLAD